MNSCIYCDRKIENKGSLKAHELSCVENPNKVKHPHSPLAGLKKGNVPWNVGKTIGSSPIWRVKYPDEKVFVENSTYGRGNLKKRILDDNKIEYVCAICGIGPIWMDKPMPLILDHINGINNDNRLENLRFVCSNCDTQLETYKSKNRGGGGKVSKEI
jgi:hypothetical protein